jgi:hypothetical protein
LNNHPPRGLFFAAVSLVFPLLYILMYIPVWGSYTIKLSGIPVFILFIFQLVAACLAGLRMVLLLCHRSLTAISANLFDIIAVFSILLTCLSVSFSLLSFSVYPGFPHRVESLLFFYTWRLDYENDPEIRLGTLADHLYNRVGSRRS